MGICHTLCTTGLFFSVVVARVLVSAAVSKAEKPATVPAAETAEWARIENESTQESTGPSAEWVIYFTFDHSDIDSKYVSIIQVHAKYSENQPNVHVRFEGYADERGILQYNMAQGERRGDSALELLTSDQFAPSIAAVAMDRMIHIIPAQFSIYARW